MMEKWMLESMMKEVIRKYGFETKETIRFCTLCDWYEEGRVTKEEVLNKYLKLVF